jgi:acyl-[acyl-carrier-protein]-phospholipid O-acyltransferase/long-chain-fatty-acid--[acyl-carrier-protein] ligase
MEGTVILAILAGQIAGGFWFDSNLRRFDDDGWQAAMWPVMFLWIGGGLSLIFAHGIERTRLRSKERFSFHKATAHVRDLKVIWASRPLRLSAIGVAFFWGFAGFINLVIIQISEDLYGGAAGFGTGVSILLIYSSVGIACGCLVAGVLSRKAIELGLTPVGGIIMTFAVIALGFAEVGSNLQYGMLTLSGFGGAVFLVPLSAYLMDHCKPGQRGVVLSASNLMNNVAGVIGVLLQLGMKLAGMSTPAQFMCMAFLVLPATIYVIRLLPREFIRIVVLGLLRTFYRIDARHADRIPETGGVLLTPNHVSFVDAFVLSAASRRHVRFLMVRNYFKVPLVGRVARMFDTVPISSTRAKEAIRVTAEALDEGTVVCIFPEGQLSRDGMLSEIKNGFSLIARKARNCVVVPVYMDGLWSSIFSCERGRFFWKWPRRIPLGMRVVFGQPRDPHALRAPELREALNALGGEAIAARQEAIDSIAGVLAATEPAGVAAKWWQDGEVRLCTWRQVEELLPGLRRIDELAGGHAGMTRWLREWTTLAALPKDEIRSLVINALQLAESGNLGDGENGVLMNGEAPEPVRRVWGALLPAMTGTFAVILNHDDDDGVLKQILIREKLRDVIGGAHMAELLASGGRTFDELRFFHFNGTPQAEPDGAVACFAGRVGGGRILSVSMPHAPIVRPRDFEQPGWREGTFGRLLPGFSVVSRTGGIRIAPAGGGEDVFLEDMTVDAGGFISR